MSAAPTKFGAESLTDWLLGEGRRIRRARELLAALCRRLNDAGVPVWRSTIHIRQLHPELFGRTYLWTDDMETARQIPRRFGTQDTTFFRESPIALIYDGGPAMRRRLLGPQAQIDFSILADLQAEGATDYSAHPVPFSTGAQMAITFATRRPGGFDDTHIALIEAILPALSPLLELRQMYLNAEALLDTYVGHDAGTHILSGEIRRGTGDSIQAILWMCDIHDFTRMSETLPRKALIGLLNDFFDCMAEPVYEHGGEVLKFIGDAMLAIFRLEGDKADRGAHALAAEREAASRIDDLNGRRDETGHPALSYGLALHVGEVIYGNIGASNRLDFTVIGPAVNLVARIGSLRTSLDCGVALSADFVAQFPGDYVSLGQHRLRGIAEPQEVFTPRTLANPS